ncbi:MAG: hypothetical protein WCD69_21470, partial [Xanthobacteraceae bacterium]
MFLAAASDGDRSPLDFMLALMRDPQVPLDLRIDMAAAAAPLVYARLRASRRSRPHPMDRGRIWQSSSPKAGFSARHRRTLMSFWRTASAQSLEQQGMCAKQAKIAFEEWTNDPTNNRLGLKPITSDYENHYNVKLNRCFVAIESIDQMGKEFLTSATLM